MPGFGVYTGPRRTRTIAFSVRSRDGLRRLAGSPCARPWVPAPCLIRSTPPEGRRGSATHAPARTDSRARGVPRARHSLGHGGGHVGQNGVDVGKHLRLLAGAVDLLGDVLVLVQNGTKVLVKGLEAHLALFLRVVRPVLQAVHNVCRGRVKGQVVDAARLRVRAPAHDALHQDAVRHVEVQHHVRDDVRLGQGVRLGGSPREAIEEPTALLAVGLREAVADHADDHLVGHELAGVHELLGLLAHVRPVRHGGT
mmetsp:Transcript_27532/g.92033  ORF Transcript_27532/g.92033 Transcript_27532/m.92033 type:complete len:254 (+) Transcript_27532:390-1151(+)